MKKEKGRLDARLDDATYRREFQQEKLILDAMELITDAMAPGTTRADLARLLGRSRSYVTQMLSGSKNLTLRSLADAMTVLGYEVKLTREPVECEATVQDTRWSMPVYTEVRSRRCETVPIVGQRQDGLAH